MDPNATAFLAANTLSLLQPYLPILATKAVEKIGEELPATVGKVWQKVWHHMSAKEAAKEAMQDLLKQPDQPDLQAAVRVQLGKLLQSDAEFAGDLKRLLEEVQPQISYQATAEGSSTIVQGSGNRVVGAGGIMIEGSSHGDPSTYHGNNDE